MTDNIRNKPKMSNSQSQNDLDKAEKQFNEFNKNVKEMTMDRMNAAPKHESEPQTQLSQKQIERSQDIYLKPFKSIGCRDKFNEDYRKDYEHAKEYVNFIAENKEIIGEMIEMWTRPFAGMPAEFWKVPTNKPIWGPRYLAEQIKKKYYHRLKMENTPTDSSGFAQFYGAMAVDTTIQRLDANPVSKNRSVFMGASGF